MFRRRLQPRPKPFLPWLFELLNRSENIFGLSQRRWTTKVPVVSVVLSRPSYSESLRKGFWKIQVFPVPGDASEDIKAIKHPKILSRFSDNLDISDALVL